MCSRLQATDQCAPVRRSQIIKFSTDLLRKDSAPTVKARRSLGQEWPHSLSHQEPRSQVVDSKSVDTTTSCDPEDSSHRTISLCLDCDDLARGCGLPGAKPNPRPTRAASARGHTGEFPVCPGWSTLANGTWQFVMHAAFDTTVSGPRRPLREDACRLVDEVGAKGGTIKTHCGAGSEYSTSGAGVAYCRNWGEALHQWCQRNHRTRSWCIWRQSYHRVGARAMYSATAASAAYTEIAGTVLLTASAGAAINAGAGQ